MSFSHLPLELINMVLDFSELEELFSLALLNQFFHELVIPQLLRICSMKEGQYYESGHLSIYNHAQGHELMRAIRIALSVKRLSHLTVRCGQNPIIPILKELARLLARMTTVTSVTLDLYFFAGSMDQQGVAGGLASVLEALRDKSCKMLTISGLDLKSNTECDMDSGPPLEIAPLTTVRSLTINYAKICSPSIRNWIVQSINMSPICILALDKMTLSEDPFSFSRDMDLLTIPSLTTLKIESRNSLHFSDVAAFLCRHPSITSLRWICDTLIPINASPLPAMALPRLTHLHTTPEYLRRLMSVRGSFLSLESVTVDPSFSICHPATMSNSQRLDGLNNGLASMARRRDISALTIVLPGGSEAENWLRLGSHPRRGKRNNIESTLLHIDNVIVEMYGFGDFTDDIRALLPGWLSLFPSLRHATVPSFFEVSDADTMAFLRAAANRCLNMKTIRINHKTYDLKQYRRLSKAYSWKSPVVSLLYHIHVH